MTKPVASYARDAHRVTRSFACVQNWDFQALFTHQCDIGTRGLDISVKLSPRWRCSVRTVRARWADREADMEATMGSKFEMARRTAARLAALAEEADDDEEREYYVRMRDAWITLANRCEFMPISDVTHK